jgi:hypothetical protein
MFNQYQSCITNSIQTRTQMDSVTCVELSLNAGYEQIFFSERRVNIADKV